MSSHSEEFERNNSGINAERDKQSDLNPRPGILISTSGRIMASPLGQIEQGDVASIANGFENFGLIFWMSRFSTPNF
jgi:hypothetical protein